MKVMMIESDWQFEVKATRYFETHAGLVVHETAQTAIAHARSWEPDLVVLSAEFASAQLLEDLASLPSAPAVLLTEHMSRFDRAWSAWQRGGDELLMTPLFHISELQDAVVSAMEKHALTTTATLTPVRAAS